MTSIDLFLFNFHDASFQVSDIPHFLTPKPSIANTSSLSSNLNLIMAEQVMEGKYYSITGAGSGIGRATAIRCVQLGAAGLTLCDLNMEGLEETKKLM